MTPYIPVTYDAAAAERTTAAGATPTPIQAGTTEVTVTVNVIYALT